MEILLSCYLKVHKGTWIAAASFRRAASRLRARTVYWREGTSLPYSA